MDGLISKTDAIIALLKKGQNSKRYKLGETWELNLAEIEDAINNMPSSDAVEVVRCKDCKHWQREILNGIEYINFSSCDLNHCGDGHNFYCADAERRTNE